MSADFDLAILGSGFGGSLLAMVARRVGLSVLLIERGAHPRFAIGESTSPLCNLLLEEIADEFDLPRLRPFSTYGTWKRAYPEVTVGLKRGFTFYLHHPAASFEADAERSTQLLVAASPRDEVADTHWYRADFDHFLVREAQELGAEYVDRCSIESLTRGGTASDLTGNRNGSGVQFRARFVVDASGPRGALSRLLGLRERPFPDYPATQALFSHFTAARRFEELLPEGAGRETPPYPPDDAALHHVFEGGWMWALRFENGITSAGFAVEDRLAQDLGIQDGEAAWRRFLDRFPSIEEQFAGARSVLPFYHSPRLPYRCERLTGDGWAMLPSAAAFVDPLFSTGFPLTLLGIHRLGGALRDAWGTPQFEQRLVDYAERTTREAESAARLVAASYRTFADFPAFADLSMLYFVSASFSEMSHRLGRGELATEFLLQNDARFRETLARHTGAAMGRRPSPQGRVAADLHPFNVAGLCDPAKRNWYGVDLQDVVEGAAKFGLTSEQVAGSVHRLGW